jgi:hypothetical protein
MPPDLPYNFVKRDRPENANFDENGQEENQEAMNRPPSTTAGPEEG